MHPIHISPAYIDVWRHTSYTRLCGSPVPRETPTKKQILIAPRFMEKESNFIERSVGMCKCKIRCGLRLPPEPETTWWNAVETLIVSLVFCTSITNLVHFLSIVRRYIRMASSNDRTVSSLALAVLMWPCVKEYKIRTKMLVCSLNMP